MKEQTADPAYGELLEENRRLRLQNQSNEERIAALVALQDVARSLAQELDLSRLLQQILRSAVQVMDAAAGSLLLVDPATDELVFEVIEGGGGESLERRRLKRDQGIAGWVATHCEPLMVDDVTKDERFYSEIDRVSSFKTNSLLCVPLISKSAVIGVLQLLNKKSGEMFDRDDLDILTIFASQSATAIENARLYQTVREERDRVIAVEEDVRRSLARDLHDSLAQLLAAALMNVRFMNEEVSKHKVVPQSDLVLLERVISKALYQVRTMLFDLRPVILETRGLGAALESYAKRLRQEGTGKLHLSVDRRLDRLPPRSETVVFAIIREALNNVRRHARAKNVWLRVTRDDASLLVTVEDDGQGFDVALVERVYAERGSIGLLSMKERADAVGGKVTIDSEVGRGTRVVLTVPLHVSPDRLATDAPEEHD